MEIDRMQNIINRAIEKIKQLSSEKAKFEQELDKERKKKDKAIKEINRLEEELRERF